MSDVDLVKAQVSTLEDWFRVAPPERGEVHWKDFRSAKEVARAWLRSGALAAPNEVIETLELNAATAGFVCGEVYGELETRLDDFVGGHRVHDVLAVGTASAGRTVLAVEAKADEAFGDATLAQRLRAKREDPRSNLPERVRALTVAIFGADALVDDWTLADQVNPVRYQLVHALAGTLIEATRRSATRAVLLVHEFVHESDPARGTVGTSPTFVRRNASDLDLFLSRLGGLEGARTGPFLEGPLESRPAPLIAPGIHYFVGKVTTKLP